MRGRAVIPLRSDYLGVRGHARLPRCDSNVRVPDNALRGVGFVSEVVHSGPDGDELDHFATGFFVSVPSSSVTGMMFLYFVTARHISRGFEGRDIRLVVNKKDGGIKQLKTIGDTFWGHPSDVAADVAVAPIYGEPDADIVYTSISNFVTQEQLADGAIIGVGDEVFVAGLFTPAPGREMVAPIIRHGNIAMLPKEQIQTELGFTDVYLIEARSLGGFSGSPVFARPTILLSMEQRDDKYVEPVFGTGGTKFLGVVQGHWDIKESEMNKPQIIHALGGVNLGIAIVTPAYKLLETLNRPELVDLRNRIEENYRRSITPTAD